MEGNKSVYHYCSIDTFFNILKGSSLRLSDIQKSNDCAERVWIANQIKTKLIERLATMDCSPSIDFSNAINNTDMLLKSVKQIYACCFSSERDLLSQWRGYAQNGCGVAIGFDKSILHQVNNTPYGIRFGPINYSLEEQQEFIYKQVEHILDLLLKKDYLIHAMSEVFSNRAIDLCLHKNPAFIEEHEWRLLWACDPRCRISNIASLEPFTVSITQARSNGETIITYFDMDFTPVKLSLITEIVLGPKCKMTVEDVATVLYIYGYDVSKISITTSFATYV